MTGKFANASVALAAALAVISPAAAAAPAPKLDWQPCADPRQKGFECATARVPLDYRHPGHSRISLAVIRHRSNDPAQRLGSLFLNPGGPGTRGTTELPVAFDGFAAKLKAKFDLVSWDPRGVGASTAVQCFSSQKAEDRYLDGMVPGESFPVGEAESSAWIQRWRGFGRRCERRNGRLLRHVSTADTARDLNLLRRAVGDRKLNYLGVSYGTLLGATYANLFPDRVRAMALDGNDSPRAWVRRKVSAGGGRFLGSYLRQQADEGSARTLNAFLDLCGRSNTDRCAFSAGSEAATRAKFAALMQRLLEQPESADVTYAELVSEAANALYAPASWPEFAQVLEDVWSKGTTSRPLVEPSGFKEQTYAIACSESPNPRPAAFPPLDAFAYERSGDIGRYWAWASEPCASWPATAADRYAGPWDRRTANPILVIGNTHDPATPYRGAKAMARQLARARLVTLDGYGHTSGADPSACAIDALTDYLVDLTLPPRGTVCQPDRAPFDPDFGQPLP